MLIQSPKVAIFDLGGVLVRICQTWQEAVAVAGLPTTLPADGPVLLTDFPAFNAFQATEISESQYLQALAAFVGVSVDRAIDVHVGILCDQYPGVEDVVNGLKAAGIRTGCLSNTNAAHWTTMTETDRFAAIARLDYRAGSHELGYAKPDPRAFQAYIDKFGLQGAEIIYFDDSSTNVEAARQFGWQAHVVDPLADPPAQIAAILADWLAVDGARPVTA